MAVNPIPAGFHTITAHLVVRGAGQAIDFYKQAFGAVEQLRHLMPDGQTVMHAQITIGDSILMLSDEFPEWGVLSPLSLNGSSVTLNLYVQNADQAFERAVSAGAKVLMPVGEQFWGDRYGQVQDPFGHKWAIASRVRELSEAEMAKASQQAISDMQAGKGSGH